MEDRTTTDNPKVSPEQAGRCAWGNDIEQWLVEFLWEFGESGMLHNEGAKRIIDAFETFSQSQLTGLPSQIEAPSEIFRVWAIQNGD